MASKADGEPRVDVSAELTSWGSAGVSKTRLVDYAVEAAAGFRISAIAGVESEINLPHGAVHQLLIPFVPLVEELPFRSGKRSR